MSNLETINLQGQTIIDGKTINNILIYGDGEVLFDCKRAEINEYPSRFSWEKLSTIIIEEVKLAKKLNLSRKDNFIIINKEHNYFNESRYDLYIHTKDIRVKNKREEISMELDDKTTFIPVADLYFTYGATKIEKLKDNDSRRIEYDSLHPFTAKEGQISRCELTDLGKEIEVLEKKFEELNIKIPSYEIKALVKNFKVTEREKKL